MRILYANVIEQNAQFEGVSRRLEKAVEAPTADQVSGLCMMSKRRETCMPAASYTRTALVTF